MKGLRRLSHVRATLSDMLESSPVYEGIKTPVV